MLHGIGVFGELSVCVLYWIGWWGGEGRGRRGWWNLLVGGELASSEEECGGQLIGGRKVGERCIALVIRRDGCLDSNWRLWEAASWGVGERDIIDWGGIVGSFMLGVWDV
ncbi:hypothetical protein Tco_1493655 [Tanacetum coccineum]